MKSVLKCNDNYKSKFEASRCHLTISVGQEAHEGEKFLSKIKTVEKVIKMLIIFMKLP
mgnify:CR=1